MSVLRKNTVPGLAPPPEAKREHALFSHANSVGMITGEAPRFESVPGGHEALKQELMQRGVLYEDTMGQYGGVPERTLLVHGLPREDLIALGKKYGQESVIHHEKGRREFIYTNGPKAGGVHLALPTHEQWPEGSPPPKDDYTKVPGHGNVRFHFDWDNMQAPPPVQPAAPTVATKHEIGYALYQTLKKALADLELEKTSWNVKQQRANITPEQAEQRRVRYAQSIGLKPEEGGRRDNKNFPAATKNKLPYGKQFGIEHETAHAMMTPRGNTVREYQRYLSRHSDPKGPPPGPNGRFEYDSIEDEPDHVQAVADENTANTMEYGIDRRAGVDPHKFKTDFRTNVNQPQGTYEWFEPNEPGRTAEAQGYLNDFDHGARISPQGRRVDPTGVDAKINARAGKITLPGAHLFKK